MSQASLDDLQSMFPQLPAAAIQDILEQAGGCDQAVEALLNMTDSQRAVLPRQTALPLVTTQLVNTTAVKQKYLHCNDTGHAAVRLSPGPWYAQHMHVKPCGRQKSPYRSPRKKERHSSHSALGILGMLSSLHDSKPFVNVSTASQGATKNSTPVKSQVLLPWQQAGSKHACQPSTPVQTEEHAAVHNFSIVPTSVGGPPGPSPVGLKLSPEPPKPRSPIPVLQITVPATSLPAGPVSPLPYSWLNAGVPPAAASTALGAVPNAGMKSPGAVSPSMMAPATTMPSAGLVTIEQHMPPDLDHKVSFLSGMFEDLQLPHDSVKKVLESSNGNVETAVNKLLEYQALLETAVDSSPSEESSNHGSGDDDETPEEKRERAMSCLRALHSRYSDRELQYVLEAADGNLDMAVGVLTDMDKKERTLAEQLSKDAELARQLAQQQQAAAAEMSQDERLARQLQEQQQVPATVSQDAQLARKLQQQADGISSDEHLARQLQLEDQRQAAAFAGNLPVPIPVPEPVPVPSEPVPRRASPPPAPAAQQRPVRTVSWEEHTERTMLSCRIKLLQRKFACRVEPDIAEAALARCDQDVVRAAELLVQSGLPLKEARDAVEHRRKQPSPEQQQLLQLSDEDLLRLRQEQPHLARELIHERTQAMYDETRRLAQKYMAEKRDAIERSSYYYSIGDYKSMEACKQEARRYGQLAYQENEKAGNSLYTRRNNTLENKWDVDLHALHIHEAIQKLDDTINTLAALPSKKVIKAITGRGAHSREEPKLYLAVKDHLLSRGLSFEGHLGYFMIYLGSHETYPAAPYSASTSHSNPPTPSRPSPAPTTSRRCRTQDDDELRRFTRAPSPPTLMDFVRHG